MVSAWYERNREHVNAYKREHYHIHRKQLLKDHRTDRVLCPLCPNVTKGYTRSYLARHLTKRHSPDLVKALDLSLYKRGGALGPKRRARGYLNSSHAICEPCTTEESKSPSD